jgi:CrcB protein
VSPTEWALVGVLGALGAPTRYVVDTLVSARARGPFPFGTLVVNVSGSLLLGVITGLALYHGLAPSDKVVVGTGFVGAYTTFSTFSFETLALFEAGDPRRAMGNIGISLIAGGLAGAAGLALAAL